jgi:hypothetical protein
MKAAILLGLLAVAGCGSSADFPITAKFSKSNTSPPVGVGYDAPIGQAVQTADQLTLTSTAGGATLLIALEVAVLGQINVGERHLSVEYSLGTGGSAVGWASDSGSITFETLDPYKVTFNEVRMINASGGATGAFTLDGTASFAK